MTPKDKAKQLVELFEWQNNYGIADNTGIEGIDNEQAKKCAIICVDEMITENKSILEMLKLHGDGRNRLVVRCRIEKLEEIRNRV